MMRVAQIPDRVQEEVMTTPTDDGMIARLNGLLADAVVSYYKLHRHHWMVQGLRFRELHQTFEELYENAHTDLDALAERVLTIGGRPLGTLTEVTRASAIREDGEFGDAGERLRSAIEDLRARRDRIRAAAEAADASGDRGTASLLDGIIERIEKSVWMLEAAHA